MAGARKLKRSITKNIQQYMVWSDESYELLDKLVDDFVAFLSKEEKPTDNDVRLLFTTYNDRWKKHCLENKLTHAISAKFVERVREIWEQKKKNA